MYKIAFQRILEKCLGLRHGDDVLLICDETFDHFLPHAEDAIEELGLEATVARVSSRQQERIVQSSVRESVGNYVNLPRALDTAIRLSSAILNVLGPQLSTSSFRRAVLEAKGNRSRVAHIPGLNEDILNIVLQTPFDEVATNGELLAWVIGEAKQLEIRTHDHSGQPHVLRANLGGWDNEPLLSTGVIAEGDWGNVPPGEVFCCPTPAEVEGSICINGSVPDYVFKEDEEIVLHFRAGKMTWQDSAAAPIINFFQREQTRAVASHDEHWNTFAELGIGLNPAIVGLTGNSLFDEKAAGTIHVAVGDNSVFGHDLVANTHADLVTRRPTLIADGQIVLREGELLIDEMQSRRRHFAPTDIIVNSAEIIQLNELYCAVQAGCLRRKLAKGKRVGYIDIGDATKASQLAQLYTILHNARAASVETLCIDYPAFDDTPTIELLGILKHYRMLKTKA